MRQEPKFKKLKLKKKSSKLTKTFETNDRVKKGNLCFGFYHFLCDKLSQNQKFASMHACMDSCIFLFFKRKCNLWILDIRTHFASMHACMDGCISLFSKRKCNLWILDIRTHFNIHYSTTVCAASYFLVPIIDKCVIH